MVILLELPAALQEPRALGVLQEKLTNAQLQRLRVLVENLNSMLAPLTRVRTSSTLEELLSSSAPRYVQIASEMFDVLLVSRPGEDLTIVKEMLSVSPEWFQSFTTEKADLLGDQHLQQLLGAFSSLHGLNGWAFDTLQKGGAEAHRLAAMATIVGEPLLRAQICILAVTAILLEGVTDWALESIPLLCSASDEYMSEVEDAFLAASYKGAHEKLSLDEELVDYDRIRQSLQLRT